MTSSPAAELDEAVAAAHRGEYATALRRLSPLAEKGDARTEFDLRANNRKSTISRARIGRLTMTIATSLRFVTFWGSRSRGRATVPRPVTAKLCSDHAGDPE